MEGCAIGGSAKQEIERKISSNVDERHQKDILYRNKIKDIGDIKKADITKLGQLLGKKVVENLKEQTGEELKEPIPEGRRKGQTAIEKYE